MSAHRSNRRRRSLAVLLALGTLTGGATAAASAPESVVEHPLQHAPTWGYPPVPIPAMPELDGPATWGVPPVPIPTDR